MPNPTTSTTTTKWRRRLNRSSTQEAPQAVEVGEGGGDVDAFSTTVLPPPPPPPPPLPPRSFLAQVAASAPPVQIEEGFDAGEVSKEAADAVASSETAVLSSSSWILQNISNYNPVEFVAEGICTGFRGSGENAVTDDDVRLIRNSLYNILFVLVAYYIAHNLFFAFFFNDELKTNIFRVYFDSFIMTSTCHKPQYIYDDTADYATQIKPILKNKHTDLPELKVYLHEKFDDAGALFSFSLIPISCLRSGIVNTSVFLDQLFGSDRRLIFLILFVISYVPFLSFVNKSGGGGAVDIEKMFESSTATITLGVMAYILFHYSSEFIAYATKLAGLMKSVEKNNDAAVEKIITNNGIVNPTDLALAAAKNAKVGTTIMSLMMGGYTQFLTPILGCIFKTILNLCTLSFFIVLIPMYLFVIANSLILTSLYRMVFRRHEDNGGDSGGDGGGDGGVLCTMIQFIRESSSTSTICFIFNYAVSFMSLFVIFYNMATFSAISSAPLKFNMLSFSLLFAAAIVCRLAYHWNEEPVLSSIIHQRTIYGRLVDTILRIKIFWKYLMNCKLVLNKPSPTPGGDAVDTTSESATAATAATATTANGINYGLVASTSTSENDLINGINNGLNGLIASTSTTESGGIINATTDAVKITGDTTNTALSTIKTTDSTVASTTDTVKDTTLDTVNTVKDTAANTVNTVKDTAAKTVNTVKDTTDNTLKKLGSILHIKH